MKIIYNKLLIFLIYIMFIISCDYQAKIAIVSNHTQCSIVVLTGLGKYTSDSIIAKYYNSNQANTIDPDGFKDIYIPGIRINTATDFDKRYLYILNVDSLNKYEKINKYNGLLKYSLVKKIEIQLNKIQMPLDTIYVKQ